jgi:translocator protein
MNPPTSSLSLARQLLVLVGWIALCFLAAATGAIWSPGDWYAQLQKPAWNPPNWIFGPVWTTLYALMGVSAWLVWRPRGFAAVRGALSLFLVQLALNALWTPVFFGLHLLGGGFLVIVLLWLAIIATIRAFARVNRVAAVLLVPYLLWVSFASVLNLTLWRLN